MAPADLADRAQHEATIRLHVVCDSLYLLLTGEKPRSAVAIAKLAKWLDEAALYEGRAEEMQV